MSLAQTGNEVFASTGSRVVKYYRGKEEASFEAPDNSPLGTIILFGEEVLALKEDGTGMIVWNHKTGGECVFLCRDGDELN